MNDSQTEKPNKKDISLFIGFVLFGIVTIVMLYPFIEPFIQMFYIVTLWYFIKFPLISIIFTIAMILVICGTANNEEPSKTTNNNNSLTHPKGEKKE